MATRVQRVAFVPSPQVRALLEEVSALSGQSMGSLVSEMMDEVAPVVRGQLDALKALKGNPEKARQYVQDYATKAINDISQVSMDFTASEDARTSEGQKARRRAARAARNP